MDDRFKVGEIVQVVSDSGRRVDCMVTTVAKKVWNKHFTPPDGRVRMKTVYTVEVEGVEVAD